MHPSSSPSRTFRTGPQPPRSRSTTTSRWMSCERWRAAQGWSRCFVWCLLNGTWPKSMCHGQMLWNTCEIRDIMIYHDTLRKSDKPIRIAHVCKDQLMKTWIAKENWRLWLLWWHFCDTESEVFELPLAPHFGPRFSPCHPHLFIEVLPHFEDLFRAAS